MPFEPKKITIEHIREAIKQIDEEHVRLKPSSIYDVIIDKNAYPPKEILRYAHEAMNGEHIWNLSGGEQTNAFLRKLRFQIIEKSTIWKLGCNWEKGNPSFYEFIKENNIVIGVEGKLKYKIGDLVLVTEGFTAYAIAKVLEEPEIVTTQPSFKSPFGIYKIPFEGWVNFAKAEWYEFEKKQVFTYKLQQGIRRVKKPEIREKVIEIWDGRNNSVINNQINSSIMNSKNIILYGPPGTGKTYNSIDWAVKNIKGTTTNHVDDKLEFDRLRKQGQIEFVTFHQNYSYEDFMVGLRPDENSGILKFEKRNGVFKQIVERARLNWEQSEEYSINNVGASITRTPDFDQVFNSYFAKLIEGEVDTVDIQMKTKSYKYTISDIDSVNGKIIYTRQSNPKPEHYILIKTIKGIYEGTITNYPTQGEGVYYYPLVEQLKEFSKNLILTPQKKEPLKNYVLIIDEINRANISRVFGELITLIEDDKRLGAENELRVTLPNGEKDFGIPPNVYIIGTMNTADKSIALVDIALRRRFEFIGYYPNEEVLKAKFSQHISLMNSINAEIFAKKNSADYLIGHGYFMKNETTETILKNKIIPLLMEYFSGRRDDVKNIFSKTDWVIDYNNQKHEWTITPKKVSNEASK